MKVRPDMPANTEEAEVLAAAALHYLAGESDRLHRFMALTGLEPDALRQSAGARETLGAVVGYLMSDERLLLGFCAETKRPPEAVQAAHTLLTGEPAEW